MKHNTSFLGIFLNGLLCMCTVTYLRMRNCFLKSKCWHNKGVQIQDLNIACRKVLQVLDSCKVFLMTCEQNKHTHAHTNTPPHTHTRTPVVLVLPSRFKIFTFIPSNLLQQFARWKSHKTRRSINRKPVPLG